MYIRSIGPVTSTRSAVNAMDGDAVVAAAKLGKPCRSRRRSVQLITRFTLSLSLGACESADEAERRSDDVSDAAVEVDAQADSEKVDSEGLAYADWGDPFASLLTGEEQTARVCDSGQEDLVHRVFCAEDRPEINNLHDLQLALGLDPAVLGGFSGSALTGHSTSLSKRSISAINPRVIMFRMVVDLLDEGRAPVEFVTLAFNRGEQFAELAIMNAEREYHFYVVKFQQECNERPDGCLPGELLTESIEHNWRNVTLYDEKALQNTILDCATCHQPDGPDTPRMLRMQEFDDPWTHWFFSSTSGGRALVEDYTAAKGDESVAGLPREDIGAVSPGGLETVVGGRDHYQPNQFHSQPIEKEIIESAALEGGNQPLDNRVPGTSPTWQLAYDASRRGEFIPAPYHNVKVTDPDKLERATEAYQAYKRGELAAEELPDLRDVFPDDHARLAEMGISTQPGLSGEEVLLQACSQCHNERLNQDQSRARFRADLQGLSRAEKDVAIERLMLPRSSVHAMPPARLRILSKEARDRAIEVLRK
jgi:mono/diheme cytochrome c family protein